jgi:death-on-curing protein
MAAAYLFYISQDQPFIEGNKRTATMTALAFLEANGMETTASDDQLHEMVMSVARGELRIPAIAEFFRRNTKHLNPDE